MAKKDINIIKVLEEKTKKMIRENEKQLVEALIENIILLEIEIKYH